MSEQTVEPFELDGFVICDWETDEPVAFIASTKDGRARERVEMGLAMRVNPEGTYFFDTREES
jgi:hypothetical protein